MSVYTKTGDNCTTSLIGGERVPKHDIRVEAYGTVDELSAQIALLSDIIKMREQEVFLQDFMKILIDLMDVEALLAVGEYGGGKVKDMDIRRVEWLENRIDEISSDLPVLRKFILPGGDIIISQANICRTVCRRAERCISQVKNERDVSGTVCAYINRLSDYFYVVGRKFYSILDIKENLWLP